MILKEAKETPRCSNAWKLHYCIMEKNIEGLYSFCFPGVCGCMSGGVCGGGGYVCGCTAGPGIRSKMSPQGCCSAGRCLRHTGKQNRRVRPHHGHLPHHHRIHRQTHIHTPCCGSTPVLTSSGRLSRWIAPRSQNQAKEWMKKRMEGGWKKTSIRFFEQQIQQTGWWHRKKWMETLEREFQTN